MMKYIDSIKFPCRAEIDEYYDQSTYSPYPWILFSLNELEWINCNDITLFYGNNGSGKSTILNLISEKIRAERNTEMFKDLLYHKDYGEFNPFDDMLKAIRVGMAYDDYGNKLKMPDIRKLITSDDIFKKIIDRTDYNKTAIEKIRYTRYNDKRTQLEKSLTFRLNSHNMNEYKKLKDAKTLTKAAYSRLYAPPKEVMRSNGETALGYYLMAFENGGIYLLDEPENSLSPIFQLELMKIIEETVKIGKCQFFICTHSPLILSLKNATIYNMDLIPVVAQRWAELENVKIYHDFFKSKENEFNE